MVQFRATIKVAEHSFYWCDLARAQGLQLKK